MSHQHKPLRSPCLGHLRRQQISTIYHGSLISLYLCFQMVVGAFQVQGPHDPLVAMLGGEAELPCFLSPPQRIKNMKITWNRSLPSRVVHLYEDGRDKPEEAMAEYLGRTELVKNVMHKGIVVLKILNVQPSDNGQYRCVIQHGSFYSDTVIELKVAALGSHPQFHVEVTRSSQLRLECKSEGWFPQPKVQWMDSEGREIPAESETHTQDKCGLFHVTTSLLLRETSQKNLTCSVWNPVLNQKKEEHFSITVAEPISTTVKSMTRRAGVASAALLITLSSTVFYLNIRLKNQAKNRSGKHQNDTHHCICQAGPLVTRDYATVPANHVEVYAESDSEGTSANALGPAILAYACVAATNPDQDGASADPPGTALGNAAIGEDTPKATNADLDPEAACTYSPGAAPAEAHDTISSSASKAFAEVRLDFKYDPKKKAELQGTTERFTGLSISPYLQKVSRELSCVNSQISCSSALSPGSTTPMQSSHPLENFSNFNKAIVSHLEPRGAVPAQ
ncbi:PREDICTED: butyrophilin subfamily 3 member A2-like [Myotis brandtii]|uniref:butyrophilin subfamily 3 member A2-like n=1 Tax=Myotis brandtii TaxID=109478 RepID=UPI0007043BBB|nr:PREDICTED: butyrophilin subfamily 3 member A2-like [Myotis brandtii]